MHVPRIILNQFEPVCQAVQLPATIILHLLSFILLLPQTLVIFPRRPWICALIFSLSIFALSATLACFIEEGLCLLQLRLQSLLDDVFSCSDAHISLTLFTFSYVAIFRRADSKRFQAPTVFFRVNRPFDLLLSARSVPFLPICQLFFMANQIDSQGSSIPCLFPEFACTVCSSNCIFQHACASSADLLILVHSKTVQLILCQAPIPVAPRRSLHFFRPSCFFRLSLQVTGRVFLSHR